MPSVNVAFVRPELVAKLPVYQLIDDCLEQQIKVKGDVYLPRPNAVDISKENKLRYEAYLLRAVFYDVTSRTLNGLVGQSYATDPEIKVPDLLTAIEKDANGQNVTLVQSSKEATEYVVSKGRAGLFVDYPQTTEVATRAQIIEGKIKPAINIYSPANIINWDTRKVGSQHLLSLVVLRETAIFYPVGEKFKSETETQYRVLELDENGFYTQTLYKPKRDAFSGSVLNRDNQTGPEYIADPIIEVIGSEGEPLKEIPFFFIGAVNNDPAIDAAPLFNLAQLNVAHYRNSADYEESCFIVGQPTYVVAGLTADWLKNQLHGVIQVGSRGGLPLPVGASAEILQPAPNAMPLEAMAHKEKQMVAIGAKLVEDKKVQQTATAANIENTSETSILATACKNVSAGYKQALIACAKMVGAPIDGIQFNLNTDFSISRMSPEERAALVAEWTAGVVTFSEMRQKFIDSGIATLPLEEAKAELAQDQQKKDDQAATAAANAAKLMADAAPPIQPGVKPAIQSA